MCQSLADRETVPMPTILFVHLTWATFRRMPMVGPSEARFLGRFLPAEAQRQGADGDCGWEWCAIMYISCCAFLAGSTCPDWCRV